MHVNGYINLKIVFGDEESEQMIMVRYLDINMPYSSNMIIGWSAFNQINERISHLDAITLFRHYAMFCID